MNPPAPTGGAKRTQKGEPPDAGRRSLRASEMARVGRETESRRGKGKGKRTRKETNPSLVS